MYDVKNEAREFVGDGRDEAINKACQFFGVVDESALAISGFEAGAIYGLATRTVIVAVPKSGVKSASAQSRNDAGRSTGRDSSRRRDRGREDRARESSARLREDREPRGIRDRTPEPEADQAAPTAGPSVGSVSGELGEIGRFLLGTVERVGCRPCLSPPCFPLAVELGSEPLQFLLLRVRLRVCLAKLRRELLDRARSPAQCGKRLKYLDVLLDIFDAQVQQLHDLPHPLDVFGRALGGTLT